MKRYIRADSGVKYVVYAEGTWKNYRALFRKRNGSSRYSTEADADKLDEALANRFCNQTGGKYTWVKKKV